MENLENQVVELKVEEVIPPNLFGLKVNKSVLSEKGMTIYDVRDMLKIEKFYVIGFDSMWMKKDEEHYHIHFADTRSLEAMRKHKQKCMPNWGKSTKLYMAKQKENSNPYAWFGYAIKELDFFHSIELNETELHNESIIQLAFKKSKLDWINKKIEDREEKKELKDKVMDSIVDEYTSGEQPGYLGEAKFCDIAPLVVKYYKKYANKYPVKSVYEAITWEMLIDKCFHTEVDYVRFYSGTRNI